MYKQIRKNEQSYFVDHQLKTTWPRGPAPPSQKKKKLNFESMKIQFFVVLPLVFIVKYINIVGLLYTICIDGFREGWMKIEKL